MHRIVGDTQCMDLGGPLKALSTSPCQTMVAAGGREVFKVIKIKDKGENGLKLQEKFNLRARNLTRSVGDVKWHPSKDYVATAATNGAVVLWNLLNKGQKQERVFEGHSRTVNRVCWQSKHTDILASASQDGKIILWDTKTASTSVTIDAKLGAVRDVQFNPFYPDYFVSGFETGQVRLWDIRKPNKPLRSIQAHNELVLSIAWHPTVQNVFASGSRDKTIKVWNLRSNQCEHTIETITSLSHVLWSPQHRNHIASSSNTVDTNVHIWDCDRPFIPYRTMSGHNDVVTGIGFYQNNANDLYVLACSKDSKLYLHPVKDSYEPQNYASSTALAWNAHNQIAVSRRKNNQSYKSQITLLNAKSSAESPFNNSSHVHHHSKTYSEPSSYHIRDSNRSSHNHKSKTPSSAPQFSSSPPSSASASPLPRNLSFPNLDNYTSPELDHAEQMMLQLPGSQLSLISDSHRSRSWEDIRDIATDRRGTPSTFDSSPTEKSYGFEFDDRLFRIFAEEYQLFEGTVEECCLHNRNVANECGSSHIANVWSMILLYYTQFIASENTAAKKKSSVTSTSPSNGTVARNDQQIKPHANFLENFDMQNFDSDPDSSDNTPSEDDANTGEETFSSSAVGSPINSSPGNLFSAQSYELPSPEVYPSPSNGSSPKASLRRRLDYEPPPALPVSSPSPSPSFSLPGASLLIPAMNTSEGTAMGVNEDDDHHDETDKDKDNDDDNDVNMDGDGRDNTKSKDNNDHAQNHDQSDAKSRARDLVPRLESTFDEEDPDIFHETWSFEPCIMEMLDFYCENGDVQMCVAVTAVIGHLLDINQNRAQEWFFEYIELLRSFKLWVCAAEVIKYAPFNAINVMNRKMTTIHNTCGKCQHRLPNDTTKCSRCHHRTNVCAISHKPVRGLYMWCQACGHGGHMVLLSEWFSQRHSCPVCSQRYSVS
eukprot:gb/GECH01002439.1/.p1 GENE.gb/GECH01002439.1/~~gb/GECH01002439.1/.p1  ORF type:complete len:937 (+),score=186.74 gb/GECH01002439.1/:1-2811(+)